MLMRKCVALWAVSCLGLLVAGCVGPQENVFDEPPAPVGEIADDSAPPEEVYAATALPESAPPPGDAWWAEALAANFASVGGYGVERPRPAPESLLVFGPDAAREALLEIVADPEPRQDDELEYTHRFMAAFVLAWHELDYDRGRDVVLRYLEAIATKDYVDPEIERELYADHYHVGAVMSLYEHRDDEMILRKLLELSQYSDGAMTDGLAAFYAKLAHKNTSVFLERLSQVTPGAAAMVCTFAAWDLGGDGTTPDPRWSTIKRQLELISGDRDHPLRDTARDTLVSIKVNLG